jgi:RNA polymerase sigma factor (sigma-70 family)
MTIFTGDEDLLVRFRVGDRDALCAVYRQYVDAVETLLRRCLAAAGHSYGLSRSSDLSDILQDVFIKAFSTHARLAYDGRREYRPFLLAIARHALIDHLRSAPREVRSHRSAIDELTAADPDAGDPVPWTDPQTISVAEHYVTALGDREREVYVERYVRCRSQEESALALGLSRQQVRTLENRLRSGLARALSRATLSASVLRRARASAMPRRSSLAGY